MRRRKPSKDITRYIRFRRFKSFSNKGPRTPRTRWQSTAWRLCLLSVSTCNVQYIPWEAGPHYIRKSSLILPSLARTLFLKAWWRISKSPWEIVHTRQKRLVNDRKITNIDDLQVHTYMYIQPPGLPGTLARLAPWELGLAHWLSATLMFLSASPQWL